MRSEEQDDHDREKIAMYGHTELLQRTAEMQAQKEKSLLQAIDSARAKEASPRERRKREAEAVSAVKRGSNVPIDPHRRSKTSGRHPDIPALRIDVLGDLNTSRHGGQDINLLSSSPRTRIADQGTDRYTVGGTVGSAALMEPTIGLTSLGDVDLNQTLASMLNSKDEDNLTKSFMESHLGAIDPAKRLSLLQSAQATYPHQSNWQKKKPEKRPIVKLDQKCLNCSQDVEHVAKLFKIACLAYKPTNVRHRGISFKRDQLMQVRKFLIGQAGQLVLKSSLMQRMGLSPKKVFDDIYLHIQDQDAKGFDVREEAQR